MRFAGYSNILLESFAPSLFGTPNSLQTPGIGQNSDGDVSDFQIAGSLYKKGNCHNSRTSVDIDMKLYLASELGKRNIQRQKSLTMA